MIAPDHKSRVVALMAEILKIAPEQIKGTDRLREDLGMDSLASLELLSCISDELDLDIELDDAMAMSTVDEAVAFVEKIYGEQRAGEKSARA